MLLRITLVQCLMFLASQFVTASPSPSIPGLAARQSAPVFIPAPLPSPTSITFNSTVQTDNGTMVETCVLSFIPVGSDIKEIENCTVSMGGSDLASAIVTPSASASSVVISVIPAPTGTLPMSATPSAVVAAAFTMPGRSLEVLPVGLGIYGGVTFITFMFVVFVTYERVQYRKAFRERRMIEQTMIANSKVMQ
ncbi:hypothetical protein SCLCIDRAFT_103671 [Scleroderma citrinum Foug A]|uniref:Uncharacterized protein n=1 Tax=Scleroderma citrinum Foug A TaxID=1036808 RepID=A0A0C3ELY5_9AGAM|nr:hypothetical protein SCLCIDRAFT_103671 [Scleroderma citrinum Foug A]